MNIYGRLKRLEGGRTATGEIPEWCSSLAQQESDLGFIGPEEIEGRTRDIASQYSNEGSYIEANRHERCLALLD